MAKLEIASDWAEFSAVVVSLVVSVALSFRYYRKDQGRPKLPLGPILMSLIASSTSGVTMLGTPAESYAYGIQYVFFITFNLIMDYILASFVFLPVLLKLNTVSIYEYFDLRFDSRVRKFVSFPCIITRTLAVSLSVIPPVIIIHHFTGFGETWITIALTVLTAFYTTIGGFKGVVWTDTLQAVAMIITMAVLTAISVVKVGGFGKVFEIAYETNRLSIPPLSLDITERISIWSYGLFICGVSALVLNQSVYQRIKCLSTEKEIRNAIKGMILGMILFTLAASFVGLSIYAYYYGCDPKDSQRADSYSSVIVFWVNEVGHKIKGLRGLYIAGITCAAISTMSTHLNTVSELVCTELLDNPSRCLVRLITFGLGLLATAVALILKNTSSLVELAFVSNFLEGIASGLFTLGALFIPANAKGALAGGLFTALLSILTVVGTRLNSDGTSSNSFNVKIMRTDLCSHFNSTAAISAITRDTRSSQVFFMFKISPFSLGTLATLSTLTVGLIVSFIFPSGSRVKTKLDSDLFCPWVHRFLKEDVVSTTEAESNPFIQTSHSTKIVSLKLK